MSTNSHRLIHAAEASPGVLGGSPQWIEAFIKSHSLKPNPTEAQSETITGDPLIKYLLTVGMEFAGDVVAEFAFRQIDWLYELAFGERYQNTVVAENGDVASATNLSDTFGTSGGQLFVEHGEYRTSGFPDAPNNGDFTAIAGSGANALVIGGGGTLTEDAAPPSTARIKKYGLKGPAGDIQAVADGLTSTVIDFTAHPEIEVGVPIVIGGPAAEPGTRFATAALNRAVTPTKIEANKLTCTDLGAAWAPDAGAGQTIRIYTGDHIDVKRGPITERAEFAFQDQASPLHIFMAGLAVQRLSQPMNRRSVMDATFGMIGMTDGSSASEASAPALETVGAPMSTGANIGEIMEAGLVDEAASFIKSMTFNLERNINADGPLNSIYNAAYDPGDAILKMPMSARFATSNRWDRFRAGAQTSFLIPYSEANQGYIDKVHAAKYIDGDVSPSQGRNQINDFRGEAQGLKDPVTGKMLTRARFEVLPF